MEQVRALVGDLPRRRDLLIEHLHRIQDGAGSLSLDHLAALAAELGLAQAEVYEVASFYYHFDLVRDGEPPPAPITVRVCDSIACSLAGAEELLEQLRARLGREVRVL
ncbi:MAG TPA: NAD(P)H-dependent oxidoreductase subunit E, partial [Longimicrobiales bacterium]